MRRSILAAAVVVAMTAALSAQIRGTSGVQQGDGGWSERDPLTGATIRWSGNPEAMPYALPVSAAINSRSAGRRWAIPEHPNCAALFDGKICICSTGWDAASQQIRRYDAATLAYVDMLNVGELPTAGVLENRQIPTFHRCPQIATTSRGASLYFNWNNGLQGESSIYCLRRLDAGGSALVAPANINLTTGSTWVACPANGNSAGTRPSIGGSGISVSYLNGCRAIQSAADGDRVFIPGYYKTADSKVHAAVIFSDDYDTAAEGAATTWYLSPVFKTADSDGLTMSHLCVHNTTNGAANMLIGFITQSYGQDFVSVVYNEAGGADGSWKLAAAASGTDADIAAGGVTFTDASVTDRQLAALADANKSYGIHSTFYDATNQIAWASINITTGTGFGNGRTSASTGCYLLKIDLSARASTGTRQTLYGPFFAGNRDISNGLSIANRDADSFYCTVSTPADATDTDAGYYDYPSGGKPLVSYSVPKTTPGTDTSGWTLLRTTNLPSGGSPYDYRDPEPIGAIVHEWNYGAHQVFYAHVPVDGSPSLLAAMVADQRVTGAHQAYHMCRFELADIDSGATGPTYPAEGTSQFIVPSNTHFDHRSGHRGVPCYGVQPYDSRLNFGDGAMSIVVILSPAGSIYYDPERLLTNYVTGGVPYPKAYYPHGSSLSGTLHADAAAALYEYNQFPTLSGYNYFGYPLVVFGEQQAQQVGPTEPKRNSIYNGWGVWFGYGGLSLWCFNNCPGTDDPTASTYKLVRAYANSALAFGGGWTRVCFTKKAGCTSTAQFPTNTDWHVYANGYSDYTDAAHPYDAGTLTQIGSVGTTARVRWFHSVDAYGQLTAVNAAAAGIWVYDRALTPTEGANVTKAIGAANQIDPEDASLRASIVARSYLGAANWKALGQGGGIAGTSGVHAR